MVLRTGTKLPTKNAIEQIKAVLPPKYKNLFDIATLSGFRIGELLNLSITPGEDRNYIDFERGIIIISKQKNKRLNEPFIIFPELEKKLKEHITQFRQQIDLSGGWIFWSHYNHKYNRLARASVIDHLWKYREQAGLTEVYALGKDGRKLHKFTMHSTRHYAINHWGKLCVEKTGIYDTNSISCLSRHKNPASLESYKVLNEDIRRKVAQTLLF